MCLPSKFFIDDDSSAAVKLELLAPAGQYKHTPSQLFTAVVTLTSH
jgi:hypothetical protein